MATGGEIACFSRERLLSYSRYVMQSEVIMPKTKAQTQNNVTLPIPKTVITQHDLKVGDSFTVTKVTNKGLVLTRKNGRLRSLKKQNEAHAVELDQDREEWMRFALTAWDSKFGDNEPEYTSDMIKKPNPEYERR
jgi:antitoxin component of MazEF toxin-antitoxin module